MKPLHLSEMTVAEQEAFEAKHGIKVQWRDRQTRRQNAAAIDKAAMATRKANEEKRNAQ